MRVLLTGATGFIGSRVLDLLVPRGDSVSVLALPDTVGQVAHRDHVRIVAGDLTNPDSVAAAIENVEVVFHLAALLPGSQPTDLVRVNVEGTTNLLNAAVAGGIRRFVFSSSTAVYGLVPSPARWPITEEFPRRPTGFGAGGSYGRSKVMAENAVFRCHEEHGLQFVIARAPVAYGRGSRSLEALVNRITSGSYEEPGPIAEATLVQWVHVQDLAEALLLAGTVPIVANQAFNVAGDELFSLADLHELIWDLAEAAAPAGPLPHSRTRSERVATGHRLRYSIDKAQRLLGYSPRLTIRDGVIEILNET